MKSSAFTYIAMSLVAFAQFAGAFYGASTTLNSGHVSSSTKLYYRALHHGPDVPDHSSNIERESTKMDKDKIRHYGPGDFDQYVDHDSSDLFDGGESEMGLAGDGNLGLGRIGRDVSPHMTRTLIAKVDWEVATVHTSTSYADELLSDQHNMDVARAQQLKNWATQNEIAIANRYSYLNEEARANQGHYTAASYDNADEVSECTRGILYAMFNTLMMDEISLFFSFLQDKSFFVKPIEVGNEFEGIIALQAKPNYMESLLMNSRYVAYSSLCSKLLFSPSHHD